MPTDDFQRAVVYVVVNELPESYHAVTGVYPPSAALSRPSLVVQSILNQLVDTPYHGLTQPQAWWDLDFEMDLFKELRKLEQAGKIISGGFIRDLLTMRGKPVEQVTGARIRNRYKEWLELQK